MAVGLPPLMAVLGRLPRRYRFLRAWSAEVDEHRQEARELTREVSRLIDEQVADNPLDPSRKTVFLVLTSGQAVRNFLCSDVLSLLRERYNLVLIGPYAHSAEFRRHYEGPGVHVLPWFENFRTSIEKFFQYYLMRKSGSRTHLNWLENLANRARNDKTDKGRFRRHLALRRASDLCGMLVGPRGMQALYHSYSMAFLPDALFEKLFSTYRPELVISTIAQHVETWSLTYHARRYGAKTLSNILSWDHPTTKPTIDTGCDYYTVWSEEMKRELATHFPYIKREGIIVGCPMFDIYYTKRGALDRDAFLAQLGLDPRLPYVLYATNTPAAMPDECDIVIRYWKELNRTRWAGRVGLLVRLHPKEQPSLYQELQGQPNVAVTLAGPQHWNRSDRWLPGEKDIAFLLNSMMHAAVTINIASTMTLESFALGLPTINIAFKTSNALEDAGLLWSFDMYHTSDHYRAIVDNGAVDLARSMEELVDFTVEALEHGPRRKEAMEKTLRQKAAYCDGTAARRFVEVVDGILRPEIEPRRLPTQAAWSAAPPLSQNAPS
jgi:hypothetical protein